MELYINTKIFNTKTIPSDIRKLIIPQYFDYEIVYVYLKVVLKYLLYSYLHGTLGQVFIIMIATFTNCLKDQTLTLNPTGCPPKKLDTYFPLYLRPY